MITHRIAPVVLAGSALLAGCGEASVESQSPRKVAPESIEIVGGVAVRNTDRIDYNLSEEPLTEAEWAIADEASSAVKQQIAAEVEQLCSTSDVSCGWTALTEKGLDPPAMFRVAFTNPAGTSTIIDVQRRPGDMIVDGVVPKDPFTVTMRQQNADGTSMHVFIGTGVATYQQRDASGELVRQELPNEYDVIGARLEQIHAIGAGFSAAISSAAA